MSVYHFMISRVNAILKGLYFIQNELVFMSNSARRKTGYPRHFTECKKGSTFAPNNLH